MNSHVEQGFEAWTREDLLAGAELVRQLCECAEGVQDIEQVYINMRALVERAPRATLVRYREMAMRVEVQCR